MRVKTKTAHNAKVNDGEPAPACQHQECARRAQYLYRNSSGFKVYRPWCEAHRPSRLAIRPDPTARPRPYAALNQAWPQETRCPFCHRKREPRIPGVLRPTCREHRGMTPTGETRKRGRPVTTAKSNPAPRRNPIPGAHRAVRTAKAERKSVAPTNIHEVTYREAGKSTTVILPPYDLIRLKVLHSHDIGHYPAATDKKLSKKYPTALIAALWYRWTK